MDIKDILTNNHRFTSNQMNTLLELYEKDIQLRRDIHEHNIYKFDTEHKLAEQQLELDKAKEESLAKSREHRLRYN